MTSGAADPRIPAVPLPARGAAEGERPGPPPKTSGKARYMTTELIHLGDPGEHDAASEDTRNLAAYIAAPKPSPLRLSGVRFDPQDYVPATIGDLDRPGGEGGSVAPLLPSASRSRFSRGRHRRAGLLRRVLGLPRLIRWAGETS